MRKNPKKQSKVRLIIIPVRTKIVNGKIKLIPIPNEAMGVA